MKDLMKLDLYELLNIKPNAVESEIRTAYRKKALVCHPDKNPDDPKAVEDFKQLSKAVEILTNKSKRADYDKILRERKAAHAKLIFILRKESKVPTTSPTARDKDETRWSKQSKEERKSEWSRRKDPKRRTPTWPPSASKSQTKKENSSKQHYVPKRDSPQRKDTKRSMPTWPPSASKTQAKSKSDFKQNMAFKFNFSSILKPATFVAPTSSDSNNPFCFPRHQNQTSPMSGFSPIIKPATFVAPSNNKGSTGFSWGSSASILKPATFIPPSKS